MPEAREEAGDVATLVGVIRGGVYPGRAGCNEDYERERRSNFKVLFHRTLHLLCRGERQELSREHYAIKTVGSQNMQNGPAS